MTWWQSVLAIGAAVLIVNVLYVVLGTIAQRNELRDYVFSVLAAHEDHGMLDADSAYEIAYDLACDTDYAPEELKPYVQEWLNKRGWKCD